MWPPQIIDDGLSILWPALPRHGGCSSSPPDLGVGVDLSRGVAGGP